MEDQLSPKQHHTIKFLFLIGAHVIVN